MPSNNPETIELELEVDVQDSVSAKEAEAWAVGKRGGVDVGSDDPTYHNNSKYYAQQASSAGASAEAAAQSAAAAESSEENAEAWAKGTKDGTAVEDTDPAYHNNAKYYAEQAGGSATAAGTSEENAEAWAVGQRDGVDVPDTDPAYHNNAKYWADVARNANVKDWNTVRYLVRKGEGPLHFPVGTQFAVNKETSLSAAMGTHTGITGVSVTEETFLGAIEHAGSGIHEFKYDGAAWIYNGEAVSLTTYGLSVTGTPADGDEIVVTEALTRILFDVVAHKTVDGSHRMVLLMHDVWYNRPFDASEALIAVPEALEAGDYHFTYGSTPYQFTLASDVAAGSQMLVTYPSSGDDLAGQTVKVYADGKTGTAAQTATISAGSGGTDLGTVGDAENSGGKLNHMSRMRYGSNNYKESAIRQWLNSGAKANEWWSQQHALDRAVGYINEAGFLHGMDADFLAVVLPTVVKCGTNNTWELNGWTKNTAYTVEDRFYLASRPEVGLGAESMDQGSVFAYFDNVQNVDRIKRDSGGPARNWWLRSPYPSRANVVRDVSSDGSMNSISAYGGNGAAAACEIG